LLATQPLLGKFRDDAGPDLRSHPIGSYVVFYRPLKGGIVVVRVLHSAQDVKGQFGD
jgi:toxin ParE1/3/4